MELIRGDQAEAPGSRGGEVERFGAEAAAALEPSRRSGQGGEEVGDFVAGEVVAKEAGKSEVFHERERGIAAEAMQGRASDKR